MTEYEITVERENGDWPWTREFCEDFHMAVLFGLGFAAKHRARLISVTIVPQK